MPKKTHSARSPYMMLGSPKILTRVDQIINAGKTYYRNAIQIADDINRGKLTADQRIPAASLYEITAVELLRDLYDRNDHTVEALMDNGLGSRGVITAMKRVPEISQAFENMTAEKFVNTVNSPDFLKFSDEVRQKFKDAAQTTLEEMIVKDTIAPLYSQKVAERKANAAEAEKLRPSAAQSAPQDHI